MIFSSFTYLLMFLPFAVLGCIGLRRLAGPRAAQVFILGASVVFYGWKRPTDLLYLFASVVVNWLFARWMNTAPDRGRKNILVAGIAANVLYLSTFKYLEFFSSIFSFALPHGFRMPSLAFPLGISFFTITQIMYLVDCYEELTTAGSLFDHATFVAFFPYVLSGPLSRSRRIRHQYDNFGGLDGQRSHFIARGLYQFSMGLFKKAVFAEAFARVANFGFASHQPMSALEAWTFSIAYAMQLYFDFSGYSDMAIGTALMVGIEIPRNFDAPYKALSITEFWQRWHISLTNFITTYLFTPMLRSFRRRTLAASGAATLLAMAIAGLWHGPAWTFVIYGALHGVFLTVNQIWRKKGFAKLPASVSWMMTYACVIIAFVYFGAPSVSEATSRVASLFNPHHPVSIRLLRALSVEGVSYSVFGVPLLLGTAVAFVGPSSDQLSQNFAPTVTNCLFAAVLFLVAMLFVNSSVPAPFIYFRF